MSATPTMIGLSPGTGSAPLPPTSTAPLPAGGAGSPPLSTGQADTTQQVNSSTTPVANPAPSASPGQPPLPVSTTNQAPQPSQPAQPSLTPTPATPQATQPPPAQVQPTQSPTTTQSSAPQQQQQQQPSVSPPPQQTQPPPQQTQQQQPVGTVGTQPQQNLQMQLQRLQQQHLPSQPHQQPHTLNNQYPGSLQMTQHHPQQIPRHTVPPQQHLHNLQMLQRPVHPHPNHLSMPYQPHTSSAQLPTHHQFQHQRTPQPQHHTQPTPAHHQHHQLHLRPTTAFQNVTHYNHSLQYPTPTDPRYPTTSNQLGTHGVGHTQHQLWGNNMMNTASNQNMNATHLQPEYLQSSGSTNNLATGTTIDLTGNTVSGMAQVDGNNAARVAAKRITTERDQFAAFVQTVRLTNATADEQSCLGVWATLSDDVKAFFGAGGANQSPGVPVPAPQQPAPVSSVVVPSALPPNGAAGDLAAAENERKRKREEEASTYG